MDLLKSMKLAAAGMKAKGERMSVISENLANKDSVGRTPEDNPYRRKIVTFKNSLDREMDIKKVEVDKITEDRSEFGIKCHPGHPAADEAGYVKSANVISLVELMDRKETQRAYEANLKTIEASKRMVAQTLDILR